MRALWLLFVVAVGCGPSPGSVADEDDSSGEPDDVVVEAVQLIPEQRLDVLLVVEDSPAMEDFQATVADNLAELPLIATSVSHRRRFDARIAVVTTTEGATGFGAFVDPPHDDTGLPAPRPTVAQPDDPPAEHPWIDTTRGNATYADADARARAIASLGTRGSAGSRFPAPLAALEGALQRMNDPNDPAHGFRRRGALLWIVFVSQGHECSFAAGAAPDPDGTVAQCWSQGVTCSGDDCAPLEGAGLRSVQGVVAKLRALEATIQAERGADFSRVAVSVVGGLGRDGSLGVSRSSDPAFNLAWGTGPGCGSALGFAMPPVRLVALYDALELRERDHWLGSLCDSSWSLTGHAATLAFAPVYCMPAGSDCEVHLEGLDDRGPLTLPIPRCAEPASPASGEPCWESRDDDSFAGLCAEDGKRPFRFFADPETPLPVGTLIATCRRDPP